ncbi:glutaredoxin domain-containing protein [Nocardia halotolerans]|uniref:Glutaredoxin domain-containing protein n=1 Tax=Nocardia halotolerans TaxID=1755878 RepID=A0ABV8VRS1_9NOCA
MTDVRASRQVVRVYWRPGCPYCRVLLRQLRRTDLRLEEVNIWADPEAAARVRSVADGNETVPTVFVGEVAMVNPSALEVLRTVHGDGASVPRWWHRRGC